MTIIRRIAVGTGAAVLALLVGAPAASATGSGNSTVIAKHRPCETYPSPSGCRNLKLPGDAPDCWALNIVTNRPFSAPRFRWVCVDESTYRSHSLGSRY